MQKDERVLHRVRDDGEVYDVVVSNMWAARRSVAWCMEDNASQTRREAIAICNGLDRDKPLVAHGYTFTLVPR